MVTGSDKNVLFYASALFAIAGCIFFLYNFDQYLFLRPQSVHFWRQTDSLSFISGYAISGNGFFHPSVLNLQCGNGNSASEFPIFYYLISRIPVLYENKEVTLKLIYLSTYFFGLANLFRLYFIFRLPFFYSTISILLVSSSMVLNYYACNVVPDGCSFGLTLSGLYFYFKHKRDGGIHHAIVYAILFSLASMLKIQYLMFPLALLITQAITNMKRNDARTSFGALFYQPLLIPIFLSFAWSCFIISYNQSNCSTCFLTSFRPIWRLSFQQISAIWDSFTNYWWSSYYYPSTFHLFFILIVCCLVFNKHISSFLRLSMLFMFFGCMAYFLLFYSQFYSHDYYFICFIPLLSLIPIAFYEVYYQFRDRIPRFMTFSFAVVLLTITALSMNYGRKKVIQRYGIAKGKIETVSEDYYTLENYLYRIGIPRDAIVLSYPDNTCNSTLYFMNRLGWTLAKGDFLANTIEEYNDRGAEYLIINDEETPSALDINICGLDWIGQHGSIKIYKLINDEPKKLLSDDFLISWSKSSIYRQ